MALTGPVPEEVLHAYGFSAAATWQPLGAGHIHTTLLLTDGDRQGVLQLINTAVFKKPQAISHNLRVVGDYLQQHNPGYLFVRPVATREGSDLATDRAQRVWRLLPFVPGTVTLEKIETPAQAFEAARGFGLFARNLHGLDPARLQATIDRFHDLAWRYEQFTQAIEQAPASLKAAEEKTIARARQFRWLVDEYMHHIASGRLPLRVTHNDTKVNNLLFDHQTQKAVCVVDLDTIMPGYFFFDLGDLVRTGVSPAGEDETDLTAIRVRKDVLHALHEGYLLAMRDVLTPEEERLIPFAGRMMTYIMALRFLSDYLNGNVYYKVKHPHHNLHRAKNQLHLLEALVSG
jgi:Ser/Thr protein kinase RdoA (MazF antagonist)